MTEAKQARLDELVQIEKDRELATLNAQSRYHSQKIESKTPPTPEAPKEPLTSEPIPIPRTRRTRTRAA